MRRAMRVRGLALSLLLAAAAWSGEGVQQIEASAGVSGTLQLTASNRQLCSFNIGLFEKNWKGSAASGSFKDTPKDGAQHPFKLKTSAGISIDGVASFANEKDGVHAQYKFTPTTDVELNTLHVSADFPVEALANGKWSADGKAGEFPSTFKDVMLFNAKMKTLTIDLPSGGALTWTFTEATQVLLQDNRRWGPSFSIRIGPQPGGAVFKKGEPVEIGFLLAANGGLAVSNDGPVTIVAGPDWVPLKLDLDVEPGSALDFSGFGFQDAPAGKHGRVIALPTGQFAFEKDPTTLRRFYGVNFCFGAQYLTREESDRLAERLMRLGYNAVRIHHYEGELTKDQPISTTLNPQKLEQLDYLLAAFAKRGLYITTDLFVSRPVKWKDIGADKPGNVPMDTFKILVPVVPAAWENWKAFSKALLDHVNPHTKLRYADDPALAWLSMINEGNYGNFLGEVRKVPEWNAAWNAWLSKQYADRNALAAAWGQELKAEEDPQNGSVALADNIYGTGWRVRDMIVFLSAKERESILKMKAFLRDELGCKALVTNANSSTDHLTDQVARTAYDYVDDHFYIDHPQFIEQPWRLPSKCPNTSPIAGGAAGGRHTAFTRLLDKPFAITEYNYSAPGRFRGVGGILTGALGALQGWGGIWRFAYSHSHDGLFQPARMDYFNMASDPLGQAAERASICLYLRGDMKPAPHCLGLLINQGPEKKLPSIPKLAPAWHWTAWLTRVGTQVAADDKARPIADADLTINAYEQAAAASAPEGPARPVALTDASLLASLKATGILAGNNATEPSKNFFRSETGEITINAPEDTLLLDTPKTAGGYTNAGKTIATADKRLQIDVRDADATVWVSSLDSQPLPSSKRLLVTHLTDLQNSDIKYAEKARQTLLDWGKLPHLVRSGTATIRLKHNDAARLKVWALSTSGKRLAEVKSTAVDGVLQFTANVAEDAANGARMLYEIAP